MNYLSLSAVARLAHLLLSEIETCQTSNLLGSGSRPASHPLETGRCCVEKSNSAARISLFMI
ncbi:hypothetical protein [Pseudomonas sp. DSP3-2-2]|uniref:hypothetical protein n=1 Tax=unclassified Pseudomonas TaxID=196821 RepID=UPI003CF2E29B